MLAKENGLQEAVRTAPQVSDFSGLSKMVTYFQPLFDVYQEDGTITD